jgi:putative inorganic carbon (HCO3(-)) transporter
VPTTSLVVDAWIIAATVALTAMVFTSEALDPVNVPKLTVLLLAAVALATTAAYRAVRHRVVALPTGVPAAAAGSLLVALVLSTAVAPAYGTALHGAYGRNSGLLAYGCALLLFFALLRSCARGGVHIIALGIGAAGLFTASYGMLQRLGFDAVPWNNPFNPIIAALGNPNFAAAYMGICAPVAVGGALWTGWSTPWRVASGATAALCLLTASLSNAAQGPLAAAAGLWVVALALALDTRSRNRRLYLTAIGTAALAGVAVVAVGAVFRSGPLASLFTGISYDARRYYWEAALTMLRDRPILGVGMDQYGGFWRSARSEQAVAQLGGPSYTDSAHSVPLQMLAQGGVVLGLAYAAFVTVIAVALVQGLRRLHGQQRLLLAMLGGSWVAYQVQSVVSIDQVPLIVLHVVTAGAVLAATGAVRLRELRLPGAVAPPVVSPNDARTKRRIKAAAAPRTRRVTAPDAVALTAVGAIALVLVWVSFAPLRANVAAKDGDAALRIGDGNAALDAYHRASELVPRLPYPWVKKGELFAGATPPQSDLAQEAYLEAAKRDPRDPNVRRAAANHAESADELDRARELYQEALALDPLNAETVHAVATFELRHGGAEVARDLLERSLGRLEATARVPAYASMWAALGDARAVLGDPEGAGIAYRVALALEPEHPVAQQGLENLPAAP